MNAASIALKTGRGSGPSFKASMFETKWFMLLLPTISASLCSQDNAEWYFIHLNAAEDIETSWFRHASLIISSASKYGGRQNLSL